jgi:hypothetical protein
MRRKILAVVIGLGTALGVLATALAASPTLKATGGGSCKSCDDTYAVCLQNVPTNSDPQKAAERKKVCLDQRDRCYKSEGCGSSRRPD